MKLPTTPRVALLALIGCAVLLAGCTRLSAPIGVATATPENGYAPLEVRFDAASSSSPSGTLVAYNWDLGDAAPLTGPAASHTFMDKGSHRVRLTVTDDHGRTGGDSVTI